MFYRAEDTCAPIHGKRLSATRCTNSVPRSGVV